jgi:hypothetical protein
MPKEVPQARMKGNQTITRQPYVEIEPTVSWAPAAHACNPSYTGGKRCEASLGKQVVRPYLKNTQHKTGVERLPSKR